MNQNATKVFRKSIFAQPFVFVTIVIPLRPRKLHLRDALYREFLQFHVCFTSRNRYRPSPNRNSSRALSGSLSAHTGPPKSCHFDHFGDPRSIQTLSRNQPCLVFHFWLILGLILPPSGAPKCVPDAISGAQGPPCGRPGWPRGVPKSSRAWF